MLFSFAATRGSLEFRIMNMARAGVSGQISLGNNVGPLGNILEPTYAEKLYSEVRKNAGDKSKVYGIFLDVVNNTAAQIPQIAMGAVGGQGAYFLTMANQIVGAETTDAVNKGYDGIKGVINGLLNTGLEFVTEKILGGIGSQLSGGEQSKLLKSVLKTVDNTISNKKVANAIAKSVSVLFASNAEGVEEFLQTFAEPIIRNVVFGENNKYTAETFSDAIRSYIVGFASGGLLSSVSVNNTLNETRAEITGRFLKENAGVKSVLSLAEVTNNNSELYNEVKGLYENGKDIEDLKLGKLYGESVKIFENFTDEKLNIYAAKNVDNFIKASQNIKSPVNDLAVDSKSGTDYNIDRGEGYDNEQGTMGEETQELQAINPGGKSENGRAWEETEESFTRRAQEDVATEGRGRRNLLKLGNSQISYVEKSSDNSNAGNAVKKFEGLGIKAVLCDGDIETNQNGITTRHSQALTAPDGTVYVSNNATLSDIEIASHEIVHIHKKRNTPAYLDYESVVCENILFGSEACEEIFSQINENHFGGKYDITDPFDARFFIRELTAYLNEYLVTNPQFAEEKFSGMFEDWEAVVEASNKFNKDIGADFSESVFSLSENAEIKKPSGEIYQLSKNILPSTENKVERKKLTLAEKQTVKKLGNALNKEIIFFDAERLRVEKGLKNAPEGYTDGNIIYISESVKNPLAVVFAHEFTDSVAMKYITKDADGNTVFTKEFENVINYAFKSETFLNFAKSKGYDTVPKLIWDTVQSRQKAGDSNFVSKSSNELRTQASIELLSDFIGSTLTSDIKSLESFVNKMNAPQKKTFLTMLKDFIANLKGIVSKVVGYRKGIFEYEINRIEKKLAKFYQNAPQTTQGQKENTADSGVRYSIKNDSNGNQYWQIETEKDIFKGLTNVNDIRNKAFEYIIGMRDSKKIVDAIDGKKFEFIRMSADEFTNSEESKKLANGDPILFAQKMRLIPSIDDLAQNANVSWQSRDLKKHKLFKEKGFENFRGRVGIDNVIFNYIIRAGKAKWGDVFYDINLEVDQYLPHVRMNTSDIKKSTSSDAIVSQDDTTSQDYSMQKNKNNSNIRYSIPTDQANLLDKYENGEMTREEYLEKTNANWGKVNEQYGIMESGENPTLNIAVPKAVEEGKYTERFARTIVETGEITGEMLEHFSADILLGNFSYSPISDEKAQKKADKLISDNQGKNTWNEAVNSSKYIGKEEIAVGEKLLLQAIKDGDTKRMLELSAELSEVFTRSGQVVQAARMLKQMSGVGKLMSVQKTVDTINKDLDMAFYHRLNLPSNPYLYPVLMRVFCIVQR